MVTVVDISEDEEGRCSPSLGIPMLTNPEEACWYNATDSLSDDSAGLSLKSWPDFTFPSSRAASSRINMQRGILVLVPSVH